MQTRFSPDVHQARSKKLATAVALAITSWLGMLPAQAAGLPDFSSVQGMAINGKASAWGGTINLNDADSFLKSGGKCAFNVSYDIVNLAPNGSDTTFLNRIYADGQLIGQQTNLKLGAGEKRNILTQFYLPPGAHTVQLAVDADNSVAETDEANNKRSLFVVVDSRCGTETTTSKPPVPAPTPEPPPAKTDITSQRGLKLGGSIGGAGGKFASWNGEIRVKASDAFLQASGKCAFNLSYDMENIGAATGKPFLNRIYSGTTLVSQQTGLMLNTGETRQINTQAYLPAGTQMLTLELDADKTANDANRDNNVRKIAVFIDGKCDGAATQSPVKPDIASTKGLSLGGAVGGAGGVFATWGSVLKVQASQANGYSEGKCIFNASYDMENLGKAGSSVPFTNRLFDGDRKLAEQTGLSINVGEARQINTQVILQPGTHLLKLQLDADQKVDEANEGADSNLKTIPVLVDGQCAAPTRK